MEKLTELQVKVDSLSDRERILVFLVAVVVLLAVLQFLFVDPVLAKRESTQLVIDQVAAQQRQQEGELAIANAQLSVGVNQVARAERDELLQEVATLDKQIQQSIVNMIDPTMMAQVLENVLTQDRRITLVSLENLPVQPLVEVAIGEADSAQGSDSQTADQTQAAQSDQGLYKHSFVITVRGTYSAAVEYFEKLADLPWQFQWESLQYEVEEYPAASITLKVHTVSMSQEWIGV